MNKRELRNLFHERKDKHDELSAMYWFMLSIGSSCPRFLISERPDFLVEVESSLVGIEVTEAARKSPLNKSSAHEIAASVMKYARNLLDNLPSEVDVQVVLNINDGVVVEKQDFESAKAFFVPLIEEFSSAAMAGDVRTLVRSPNDFRRGDEELCPELPYFLSGFQLVAETPGHSIVTGGVGFSPTPFTQEDLARILAHKHKALEGYRTCDEQWLVIVSGDVPPLFVEHAIPPDILLPRNVSKFLDPEFSLPIKSDFDKVYFFNSPADAILLT